MKKLIILLILILLLAALVWWRQDHPSTSPTSTAGSHAPPPELVPFRTAGGTLQTNGFQKTEVIRRTTGNWRGTTTSAIQLTATYRYEIELRSADWNIYLDETRKVAFVVAPAIRPQLPVAVDSRTVYEWTESGWGRFDKWEQLTALRREVSPYLEQQASSPGYLEVARGQARLTVEEFVRDWLLKIRGWPADARCLIKVYFADEPDIPFPYKKSLKDFLP